MIVLRELHFDFAVIAVVVIILCAAQSPAKAKGVATLEVQQIVVGGSAGEAGPSAIAP